MNETHDILFDDALSLLEKLIAVPSLSKEENAVAGITENFLREKNIPFHRLDNNVWCVNKFFNDRLPSILLNSHLDTVPPNVGYTKDPFLPVILEGKLYGLGSTDAGASLVSLLAAFLHYYEKEAMPYNIVFAATAEEEISGRNGISLLFEQPAFREMFMHSDSFAIVGEPTGLELAVAEKGLLVLDCKVKGKAGHAARDEGDNAIYKAVKAIDRIKDLAFEKVSPLLGKIKMTVTSVNTENKTHNIIPADCHFIVDVRTTEMYTPEEIIGVVRQNVDGEVIARSTRLRSTAISIDHPIVQAGISLGKKYYSSPTMSDKALIPLPALKCGPGNSVQSHSADEFVQTEDIAAGIRFYIDLLGKLIPVDHQ